VFLELSLFLLASIGFPDNDFGALSVMVMARPVRHRNEKCL